MDRNSVADVLRGLAEGDKARSETARLRDVIDEVETALAAGVSRAAILEALHSQGFTMTLKSFESALYRIRRQRNKEGGKAPKRTPEKPVERQKEAVENPASDAAEKTAVPGKFEKKQSKTFGHSAKSDGINDLLK